MSDRLCFSSSINESFFPFPDPSRAECSFSAEGSHHTEVDTKISHGKIYIITSELFYHIKCAHERNTFCENGHFAVHCTQKAHNTESSVLNFSWK